MHPALFKLYMLGQKATFRRTLRGAKTVRGALLLLFLLGFVAMIFVPQIIAAVAMKNAPGIPRFADALEPFASFGLLGFTLLFVFTSVGEKAIYFSPAEVDFLFPAPFSRWELLSYKLLKTAVGVVLMGLLTSVTMMIYFRSWLCSFVGIMLSLAMLQLLGMATAMVGQTVAESMYTWARKALLAVVLLALFLGLGQAARRAQARGIAELSAGLRESQTLRVLLAPFDVFTRATFARSWFPDLLIWGAAALAIDLALLALIFKLDANYLESAAAISQKVYEQMRRAKVGGGVAMPAGARAGWFRLPQPPWFLGAGPIAWRQVLLAIRTSRHMFFMCLTIAVIFSVAGKTIPINPGNVDPRGVFAPMMGIGMTMYLSVIFSMQLPWAFRGDVDHLDFLKTLPMPALVLTIGELAGGVLLLTLLQLILFSVFAIAAPAGIAVTLLAAAFTVPFNGLLLGMSNLLFLIYPVRFVSGTTFDFQTFGRMMLFAVLQLLLLLPLFGVPAAFGGLVYALTNFPWQVSALTAWVLMLAELPPLIMIVSWAFQRFDVSTETPAA